MMSVDVMEVGDEPAVESRRLSGLDVRMDRKSSAENEGVVVVREEPPRKPDMADQRRFGLSKFLVTRSFQ